MKFFIKALKSILLSAILFSLTILFILTINYDLRRGVFERAAHMFSLHQETVIKTMVHQKRFDDVSNRIIQYIEISEKISSGRSTLFPNIVNVTEFAVERSTDKEELITLVPVFMRLLKIDPNLYRTRVWLAEAIGDSDYNEAISNIEKAIELSAVDEDAYRMAIEIAIKNNDQKLAQQYCHRYMEAQLGGQHPDLFYTGYGGAGLRGISVKFNTNEDHIYSHAGVKLGVYRNYEFIPETIFDFEEMSMFLNVVPGTNITIDKISFFAESGDVVFNASDFMTTTRSAYDLSNHSTGRLNLISMGTNTEAINMRLDKIIYGVRKIHIEMMFSRIPLASTTNLCK